MKIYLAVPYSEKDEAKLLGARWDAAKKLWFAPNGEKVLINRWPLSSAPINGLKGEDRGYGDNKLYVDLVPDSCWFTNVRKCIHPSDWDRLRKFIYERANHTCECCGSGETLDAHERWHYNEETKTQKLVRIIALCKSCHEATHMGLAQIRNRGEIAERHLMKVTGMDFCCVSKHIQEAISKWEYRNRIHWDLDLSIISDSGIQLVRDFNKYQRSEIAEDETLSVRRIQKNSMNDYIDHLFNGFG